MIDLLVTLGLVGAATSTWMLTSLVANEKIKEEIKNKKPTVPVHMDNKTLNRLLKFFSEVEQGNYEVTKEKGIDKLIQNQGYTKVYIFENIVDLRHVLFVVRGDIALNLIYNYKKRKFERFESKIPFLSEDEKEIFVTHFISFMENVYEDKPKETKKTLVEEVNEIHHDYQKGVLKINIHGQSLSSLLAYFKDVEILDKLNHLINQFFYLDSFKECFDMEKIHHYEKLRNESLYDVISSYLVFTEEEKQENKSDLLLALDMIAEKLVSFEEEVRQRKQQEFQKRILLLKN